MKGRNCSFLLNANKKHQGFLVQTVETRLSFMEEGGNVLKDVELRLILELMAHIKHYSGLAVA